MKSDSSAFILIARLLAVALFSTVAGCSNQERTAAAGSPQPPDGPPAAGSPDESSTNMVVEVDGVALTEGQLSLEIGRTIARQGMSGLTPEQLSVIRGRIEPQVVDRFVAQQVLIGEARRQNIAVSEDERQKAIEDITSGLPEDVSLDDILAKNGMTVDKFTADLVEDLKVRKLVDNKMAAVEDVTEEEIRGFYDEKPDRFAAPETVHARHILIQCEKGEEEATRQEKKALAEDVRSQLVEGADFAEMAQKHSDCPSKKEGGDLGSFGRGRMVKAFEDAAFAQDVDAIGPVVETDFGYHVIQVLAHEEPRTRPYEEVQDDIQAYLNRDRKQEAVEAYIEELKNGAEIRYAEPNEM